MNRPIDKYGKTLFTSLKVSLVVFLLAWFFSEGYLSFSQFSSIGKPNEPPLKVNTSPQVKEEQGVVNIPFRQPEDVLPDSQFLDLTESVPEFILLAGSYSEEANAINKQASMLNLGFEKAEIIKRNVYFSIAIDRYDKKSDAKYQKDRLLTDYGIKSYVYTLRGN